MYVLTFFKKGDSIQGGTLYKEIRYLNLHSKENLIKQTSFLQKRHLQKPMSFKVNRCLQIWDQIHQFIFYVYNQDFYDMCLKFFDPMASAMKFVKAKQSATAKGDNCAYGPTL